MQIVCLRNKTARLLESRVRETVLLYRCCHLPSIALKKALVDNRFSIQPRLVCLACQKCA